MTVPVCVVDAFTSHAFAGNPAGVCLLDAFPSDVWMQKLAAELKLSETAFVVARGDGDHDLRWFTPAVEVALCGHATLATAHVLGGPRRFHTQSGVLTCTPTDDGWIEMDFPALPPATISHDAGLARALRTSEIYTVAKSRFDLLVEVADAGVVRELQPDIDALRGFGARGYIVTAPGGEDGTDFVSRFFAPAAGVDEDPVTGSAHCVLAPFWSDRLGRASLVDAQLSARGGVVRTRLDRDRVHFGGQAVTVWEGELRVDPT